MMSHHSYFPPNSFPMSQPYPVYSHNQSVPNSYYPQGQPNYIPSHPPPSHHPYNQSHPPNVNNFYDHKGNGYYYPPTHMPPLNHQPPVSPYQQQHSRNMSCQ